MQVPLAPLRFDQVQGYTPTRLRVLWVENTLDCRTWAYYCDLRDAMAKLHELCVPMGRSTCVDGRRGFKPEVVVVGPRYMANVGHADETIGFNRALYPNLPLAVVQVRRVAAATCSRAIRLQRAPSARAPFLSSRTRPAVPHVRRTRCTPRQRARS